MNQLSSRPGPAALLHGASWRAVSLACRVGFLLLVVPRTSAGDFGLFFSYSSLALLLSRVVSLGAVDGFPTRIKADPNAMNRACRDLLPLCGLSCAMFLLSVISGGLVASTMAVALSMATGLMVSGAVRSVWPAWFERYLNLHPIFFLLMALAMGTDVDAVSLMNCQAGAILLSQAIVMIAAIGARSAPSHPEENTPLAWLARLRRLHAGGAPRMVSDVLVAACIRSVAVGSLLLVGHPVSDALALALALSEAIWTVGMILVHRNFSYYCSSAPDLRQSLGSATALLGTISLVGVLGAVAVVLVDWVPLVQRFDPVTLAAAIGLFGALAALSELRYFDLASGKSLNLWTLGQLAFLLVAGCVPLWLGERTGVAALYFLGAATTVGLVARRVRDSPKSGVAVP